MRGSIGSWMELDPEDVSGENSSPVDTFERIVGDSHDHLEMRRLKTDVSVGRQKKRR